MNMYFRTLMNRPIDKSKDIISPGGYDFTFADGSDIQFDFETSTGYVSENSPNIIEFELTSLDTSEFPESEKLNSIDILKDVKKINEFFVYTGEDTENDIKLCKILYIEFELDGKYYPVDSAVINDYNKTMSQQ